MDTVREADERAKKAMETLKHAINTENVLINLGILPSIADIGPYLQQVSQGKDRLLCGVTRKEVESFTNKMKKSGFNLGSPYFSEVGIPAAAVKSGTWIW